MNPFISFDRTRLNRTLSCAMVCAIGLCSALLGMNHHVNAALVQTTTPDDQPSTAITDQEKKVGVSDSEASQAEPKIQTATLGSGCFWCSEAVFARLKGVESVKSGYMGGQVENPTYKQVCTGLTGHAEVIQIEFDANQISFAELLEVFWKTHDPTTLNQQGNDFGPQYRSVVFYHSEEQKNEATHYKDKLTKVKAFRRPIVTEISPASEFYIAEDYHQEYFKNNPRNPYCRAVIPAKLKKLKAAFADKLKDDPKKKKDSASSDTKNMAPKGSNTGQK